MTKTSVYVDERQKADLEAAAAASGRSQADLIRDGIEYVTQQHLRRRPMMKAVARGATVLDRADELMAEFGR
jgi:hypothetical protein